MENNVITSDGETQSLPAPAEHQVMLPVPAEPPAKVRTAKVCHEFSGLVKRPYFSMPNIAMMCGVANGQSEKEYYEFFGLTKRQYYSMPNIPLISGADDAIQLQSPSSSSTRPVSVGAAEGDVASNGNLTGPPNICVTFTATEETGVECIPVLASDEDLNGLKIPADVETSTDLITSCEAEIEFKTTSAQRVVPRRTWWKRTKKFVRQLFCCVPVQD